MAVQSVTPGSNVVLFHVAVPRSKRAGGGRTEAITPAAGNEATNVVTLPAFVPQVVVERAISRVTAFVRQCDWLDDQAATDLLADLIGIVRGERQRGLRSG